MFKDLCRIGSRLSLNQWMRWVGLGFLGLLLLTLLTRCNSIENDIQKRTTEGLKANGMGWAQSQLDGRGRDVLLSGIAPSEASKTQAIALVASIDGVRTVSNNIKIKQYVSSTFSLKASDDKVVLSGIFPDQDSIDSTVAQARDVYGEDKVVNELTVSDNASKPAWLAGAVGVMAAMKAAEGFSLDASDEKLVITGVVETEEAKTLIVEQANTNFSNNVTEAIQVVKKGPTPEELAAEAARLAELDRLAEEKRLAAEAEALRLAEAQQQAEEERVAMQVEARRMEELERLAQEKKLAAEAEAIRLAEEKRLAEVEALRLAEQQRFEEEEAQLLAEKERLAAAEKARLDKLEANRVAAEKAQQAKLDAIRIAKEQKLAAAQLQSDRLTHCEVSLNHLLDSNDSLFFKNTNTIKGRSYPVLAMLAVQINSCSHVLHQSHHYINIQATSDNSELAQRRQQTVVSYLENITGAHRGLLRLGQPTLATSNGTSQLTFTITK